MSSIRAAKIPTKNLLYRRENFQFNTFGSTCVFMKIIWKVSPTKAVPVLTADIFLRLPLLSHTFWHNFSFNAFTHLLLSSLACSNHRSGIFPACNLYYFCSISNHVTSHVKHVPSIGSHIFMIENQMSSGGDVTPQKHRREARVVEQTQVGSSIK